MLQKYYVQFRENQGIIDRLDNQFEFFHGHTLDISGGGIKLSTEKELEKRRAFNAYHTYKKMKIYL